MTRSGLRAHALQHVRFEGLGSIEPWLVDAGYAVTHTRFFEAGAIPSPDEVDLIIALGGPMSVNDEAGFSWLREEKRFIRRAIESGTAVLGICLGAQLIASAMGARVYPNPTREIGWFPVHGVGAAVGSGVSDGAHRFPETFDAFHWHGETFDLPPGATLIARNQTCANQAFAMGASTLGMQFHLEATHESVRELVANCRNELIEAPFVQTEATILETPPKRYRQINSLMDGVLRHLTAAPRATARKK